MLARLGPLFVPVLDFWIPALALAVDQSEPKASPEDFLGAWVAGLLAVAVGEAAEDREGVEAWENEPGCCCWLLLETEVK
jgi:hypothetical protein